MRTFFQSSYIKVLEPKKRGFEFLFEATKLNPYFYNVFKDFDIILGFLNLKFIKSTKICH